MKHDTDYFTHSCKACGATEQDVVEGCRSADCPGGPGTSVRGITHLIMRARLRRVLGWDRPYHGGYPG